MSFGLYRDSIRQRKRRRALMFVAKTMALAAAIGGAGYYGYVMGSDSSLEHVGRLDAEIASLNGTIEDLKRTNDQLRAAELAASLRESQWQERYRRDVPKGEIVELMKLAQQKQSEGVATDRLAFVIKAAQQRRDCDNSPLTKRFVVKTPVYRGTNNWVNFGDNLVTVTATGESALSAEDKPEAWYDPSKPVQVAFNRIGGDTTTVEGVLPLHQSVVVGDVEYRFSLTAGDRGFVNISGDRCRYP
jgi:hypothetical protein